MLFQSEDQVLDFTNDDDAQFPDDPLFPEEGFDSDVQTVGDTSTSADILF